ncbi:hypothetical protein LWC34_33410 [Kibdelosporangium philippinense]|uniref:Uncharacterized protein n=1 Tax=Kibdelosporangium philippinense TaxID=211113 RepID=A0ABS8ZIR1_9PSEU|nr:hypothetical protein [Kibdelosporangium philippinense]MCE7007684.1 hypothetical protein [Kibdelosporangium philippinense]
MAHDPRWDLLSKAEPRIIDGFASHGVIKLLVSAAFESNDWFSITLSTQTDEQRNRFGTTENPLLAEVRAILMGAGVHDEPGLVPQDLGRVTGDRRPRLRRQLVLLDAVTDQPSAAISRPRMLRTV